MRNVLIYWCGLWLLSFVLPVAAYEQVTHQELSEKAAEASILKDANGILKELGLKGLRDLSQTFPNSNGDSRILLDVIKDGADFEDTNIRPLFHFFDPLQDEGLLFFTSPTWALEDKGKIHLLQNYSFSDARDHLYKALTLLDDGERKRFFGKAFESLGRVIHHVQDMAQPQHVRLDAHLNLDLTDEELPFEKRSRYEQYTKDNPGKLMPLYGLYPPVNAATDANFLTTARSFWRTQNKNPAAGLGIAEFTNTNFLSARTNFDTVVYPSPKLGDAIPWDDNANSLLEREGLTVPPECLPPNQSCVMTFYRSRVQDNYRSTASKDNDYTSTLSIFDQDLQAQDKRAFSLNRFNFNAAQEFLIPRAVAYSAGLIDYFFRGKLEAEDVTFTDTGISLRVKNAIDSQTTPAWQNEVLYAKNSNGSAGSLVVAFDYQDSAGKTQYGVSSTVPVRATDTLTPGQVSADIYNFTLTIPSEAKDVNYRLVFRGRLGEEDDAVVVGKVEPISGFVVFPNYLPTDGISGSRAIFKQGRQWRLSDKKDLVAGNIDWKGWYRNGRPTKVLSWQGPDLRYFPDVFRPNFGREKFDNVIFENGKVLDAAPARVLGAAITKDHGGVEWVVAIVKEDLEDVVYRRFYTKNDPPDPREQWQEIARFHAGANDASLDAQTDEALTPWFFNGNGTEAQTMRIWGLNTDVSRLNRLKRLKMTLNMTADAADFHDHGNLDGFQQTVSCSGGFDAEGHGTIAVNGGAEGEYIIAVDYKDDREVHAKIRLDSALSEVYVDRGSSIVTQFHWKEYIDWGTGEILYYNESRKAEGNSAVQNQEAFFRWRQVLYGLDLRHDLYAYTYFQDKKNARVESMGSFVPPKRTGTEEFTEGGQIDRQGHPSSTIYETVSSTDDPAGFGIISTPSQCGVDYSINRYGTLDFSFGSGLAGSVAVDTNDNLAASFAYYDFAFRIRGPFNYLSDGSLAIVVPGGPAIADYMPIGVLR